MNKKNLKIIIIISTIIIVVFVALEIYIVKINKNLEQQVYSLSDCKKFLPNQPFEAFNCYMEVAKNTKDASVCDEGLAYKNFPYVVFCNETCYTTVAESKRDYLVCDSIIDYSGKCYCYYRVGLATKDFSAYEKIKLEHSEACSDEYNDYKGSDQYLAGCYADIARTVADINICNEIKTDQPGWKSNCYAGVGDVKSDVNICAMITGDNIADRNRNFCYWRVAANKKDVSICSLIDNSEDAQLYKDNCYWSISSATSDTSICDMIKGLSAKDSCKKGYLQGE